MRSMYDTWISSQKSSGVNEKVFGCTLLRKISPKPCHLHVSSPCIIAMYQLLYLNVFDTRMCRISKVSDENDTYALHAIRDDTQQG